VPQPAEIDPLVFQLMTGVISGKPSMPLTNGYSIGSPKRRASARRRAGGNSWSRKKITRWSSHALRIAATVSASSSRERSTPKISAPNRPRQRTDIEPFSGHDGDPTASPVTRPVPSR